MRRKENEKVKSKEQFRSVPGVPGVTSDGM